MNQSSSLHQFLSQSKKTADTSVKQHTRQTKEIHYDEENQVLVHFVHHVYHLDRFLHYRRRGRRGPAGHMHRPYRLSGHRHVRTARNGPDQQRPYRLPHRHARRSGVPDPQSHGAFLFPTRKEPRRHGHHPCIRRDQRSPNDRLRRQESGLEPAV